MLYTDGNSWPSHKDENFWDKAGAFIQQQLQTDHCRAGRIEVFSFVCVNSLTGKSCRTKVTTYLAKQFTSPAVAEQHFISLFSSVTSPALGLVSSSVPSAVVSTQPAMVSHSVAVSIEPAAVAIQTVSTST